MKLVPPEYYYEGYFSEGEFNGRGRKIKSDGTLYDGEWKSGMMHGFGFYLLPGNLEY